MGRPADAHRTCRTHRAAARSRLCTCFGLAEAPGADPRCPACSRQSCAAGAVSTAEGACACACASHLTATLRLNSQSTSRTTRRARERIPEASALRSFDTSIVAETRRARVRFAYLRRHPCRRRRRLARWRWLRRPHWQGRLQTFTQRCAAWAADLRRLLHLA